MADLATLTDLLGRIDGDPQKTPSRELDARIHSALVDPRVVRIDDRGRILGRSVVPPHDECVLIGPGVGDRIPKWTADIGWTLDLAERAGLDPLDVAQRAIEEAREGHPFRDFLAIYACRVIISDLIEPAQAGLGRRGMRASTLWQPYASLVAVGAKPFETRSYPPPTKLIGQRIAIHAAKKPIDSVLRLLPRAVVQEIMGALEGRGVDTTALPHGSVVCTAILAGAGQIDATHVHNIPRVVPIGNRMGEIPSEISTDPFGDYRGGRWCWLLTDVQRLDPPVPAKGMQGWWTWEPTHA